MHVRPFCACEPPHALAAGKWPHIIHSWFPTAIRAELEYRFRHLPVLVCCGRGVGGGSRAIAFVMLLIYLLLPPSTNVQPLHEALNLTFVYWVFWILILGWRLFGPFHPPDTWMQLSVTSVLDCFGFVLNLHHRLKNVMILINFLLASTNIHNLLRIIAADLQSRKGQAYMW